MKPLHGGTFTIPTQRGFAHTEGALQSPYALYLRINTHIFTIWSCSYKYGSYFTKHLYIEGFTHKERASRNPYTKGPLQRLLALYKVPMYLVHT